MRVKRTLLSAAVIGALCSCATAPTNNSESILVNAPSTRIEQVYVEGKLRFATCAECPQVTPQYPDTGATASNLFSFAEATPVPGTVSQHTQGNLSVLPTAVSPVRESRQMPANSGIVTDAAGRPSGVEVQSLPPVQKNPMGEQGHGVVSQFMHGGLDQPNMAPEAKKDMASPVVSTGEIGTGSAQGERPHDKVIPAEPREPDDHTRTIINTATAGAKENKYPHTQSHDAVALPTGGDRTATGDAVLTIARSEPKENHILKVVVKFGFGKALLTDEGEKTLHDIARASRDGSRIVVRGYTDSIGSKQINDALAKIRAEIVQRMLVREGVSIPIAVSSEGLCCYVSPNNTDAGRAANRRVEITVEKIQSTEHASATNLSYVTKESGT